MYKLPFNLKIKNLNPCVGPEKRLIAARMNSRRFSVKKMGLKSTFGFTTVNHNYNEAERQILDSYHSLEYLPPHSKARPKPAVGGRGIF